MKAFHPEDSLRYVKLTSASRTDKGVHAVGNLVTCKLRLESRDIINQLPELLNSVLPDDIRVMHSTRISEAFSPRASCQFRKYYYMLPDDQVDWKSIKTLEEKIEKLKNILGNFVGTFNFHNFTKGIAKQLKIRKVSKEISKQKLFRNIANLEEISDFNSKVQEIEGNVFVGTTTDLMLNSKDYPYDLSDKNKLDECLDVMESCTAFNADYLKRNISSINVENVIVNSKNYFRIELVGNSFLLHQIRKIIGSSLAILNGTWSENLLKLALKTPYRIPTPVAPSFPLCQMYVDSFVHHKVGNNSLSRKQIVVSSEKMDVFEQLHSNWIAPEIERIVCNQNDIENKISFKYFYSTMETVIVENSLVEHIENRIAMKQPKLL